VILTEGGRFGGFGILSAKNKPVFVWNFFNLKRARWEGSGSPLAQRKHTLEFDFKYDGLGMGTLAFNNMSGSGRWKRVLKIDGKVVDTQKLEHSIPLILQWDETFDVGPTLERPWMTRIIRSHSNSLGILIN
jgi:arylsulfatase